MAEISVPFMRKPLEVLATGLRMAGPLLSALGERALYRIVDPEQPEWLDSRDANPELHDLADALEDAAAREAAASRT